MQFEEILRLPEKSEPLKKWPVEICALWYDRQGEWEKAHELVQDADSGNGAWVHAYLHRKEGDLWNADYWYHRAGRRRPDTSITEEWFDILKNIAG
ncbi:hypothetical protein LDX50_20180 [Fulvivirga sp. 1062]|uniref:Tetratricopeptide repeat protein n=2 Tax=Fulvivirga sedimenti TaxID=2879465 RepID=A0A9X1L0P6_9BACT|nr:hypothetical protein [Fulvivirga sedimenti]MCA6074904.1 hypothetical protein [Fulvivirga sedimenti]MCA6076081.1 hypothetical protein [Fulvivirga sedimenti]MCA6077209.1 hypothetical protein [Fulvivirga sedimenti]